LRQDIICKLHCNRLILISCSWKARCNKFVNMNKLINA
jgi:hypothetical protein